MLHNITKPANFSWLITNTCIDLNHTKCTNCRLSPLFVALLFVKNHSFRRRVIESSWDLAKQEYYCYWHFTATRTIATGATKYAIIIHIKLRLLMGKIKRLFTNYQRHLKWTKDTYSFLTQTSSSFSSSCHMC